jgi:serine/threonine-protein kinase
LRRFHRSDVFSLGIVLYEMLTGRQPLRGETAPDVLASVLVRDADLTALPPNLNSRLTELLKRCLEKNPKRRWQAVGDLRAELETIAAAPHAALATTTQVVVQKLSRRRRAIPVALTALVTAAITAAIAWVLWPAPAADADCGAIRVHVARRPAVHQYGKSVSRYLAGRRPQLDRGAEATRAGDMRWG